MWKFYVVESENGATYYGEFGDLATATNFADVCTRGHKYTLKEYDSQEEYDEECEE